MVRLERRSSAWRSGGAWCPLVCLVLAACGPQGDADAWRAGDQLAVSLGSVEDPRHAGAESRAIRLPAIRPLPGPSPTQATLPVLELSVDADGGIAVLGQRAATDWSGFLMPGVELDEAVEPLAPWRIALLAERLGSGRIRVRADVGADRVFESLDDLARWIGAEAARRAPAMDGRGLDQVLVDFAGDVPVGSLVAVARAVLAHGVMPALGGGLAALELPRPVIEALERCAASAPRESFRHLDLARAAVRIHADAFAPCRSVNAILEACARSGIARYSFAVGDGAAIVDLAFPAGMASLLEPGGFWDAVFEEAPEPEPEAEDLARERR